MPFFANLRSKFSWISEGVVLAIHEAQIAEHGGIPGIRDAGLLQSALARPRHAVTHGDRDAPRIAALYALGVIKNHPFFDGNKRVGAVLLALSLEENGYRLTADDAEFTVTMLALAAGRLADEDFEAWVRRYSDPL